MMKKFIFYDLLLFICCASFAQNAKIQQKECPFLCGKSISILGDSYSTFSKWIPEGYAVWYTSDSKKTDVHRVEDTWWWKLCDKTGCTLLRNSSYSGSTICNTGYHGDDVVKTSFITRMKKDMGEERVLEPKPQIIFVFGGTNDSWANSPLGVPDYGKLTAPRYYETFPSACFMFEYLKKWNPGTTIYFLANDGLKEEFYTGMQEICKHYQIPYIPLEGISKQNGHPNIEGMETIANQIIKFVNKQ